MQGIIRTMRAERGFGFVRDAEGDNVYFHRSVVIPPERFVTLAIGTVVEFEQVSGPRGSWATTLTVVPETHR
jgi:cold shock CspA family protein